jgi:hypothetical protein
MSRGGKLSSISHHPRSLGPVCIADAASAYICTWASCTWAEGRDSIYHNAPTPPLGGRRSGRRFIIAARILAYSSLVRSLLFRLSIHPLYLYCSHQARVWVSATVVRDIPLPTSFFLSVRNFETSKPLLSCSSSYRLQCCLQYTATLCARYVTLSVCALFRFVWFYLLWWSFNDRIVF